MQKIQIRLIISIILIALSGMLTVVLFFNLPTPSKEEIKETPKPTQEITEEQEDQQEEETEEINLWDTESVLLIANKKNPLPEGYVPSDLVDIDVPKRADDLQLRQEAHEALKEMIKQAEKEGVNPIVLSAYRSYQDQEIIYQQYAREYGKEKADTFSARAGYSDHQTGLTIDFVNYNLNYDLKEEFEKTEEGKWLLQHSYEYGFILRYPKGKEDITGYIYEPWHYRYIGKEYAKKIHDQGEDCTYEEYFGVEGGQYEE